MRLRIEEFESAVNRISIAPIRDVSVHEGWNAMETAFAESKYQITYVYWRMMACSASISILREDQGRTYRRARNPEKGVSI
jgi:hypothetical protein